MQTEDRNLYGAFESNGLVNGTEYHAGVDHTKRYTLADVANEKGTITRVRILTERVNGTMYCDISYIHATLPDGRTVEVMHPIGGMTLYHTLKGQMIDWAKAEGVYAKGIGLLDKGNWSVLN